MTGTLTLLPVVVAGLRRRWLGFAGSFIALALGVGLIAAVGLLLNAAFDDSSAPGAPSLHKLLTFSSFIAGFVSVFVVASTFAFAVAQRRQETALLRAIGATPRQVQRLVLGEALVVAVAAAATGCLLGLAVAPGFASWLVSHGAAQRDFRPRPGVAPLLTAASVGLAVALLGAFTASRRASRVGPAEALGDAQADRRLMPRARWLLGIAYLVVTTLGVADFFVGPRQPGSDPSLHDPQNIPQQSLLLDILVIIAIAVFAPLLVPPLVRLLTLPTPLMPGAAGLLARQNALAAVRRTVSTATPAFLVISLTGSVVGGTLVFAQARVTQTRASLQAQYVVEPDHGSALPDGVVRQLRTLPGTRVTTMAPVTLDGLEADPSSLADRPQAFTASIPTNADVVDGDLRSAWKLKVKDGSIAGLHGRTVAVSAELAKAYDWRVGDRLTVSLPDGSSVSARLAGLFWAQLGLAQVLLPRDAVAGHAAGIRPDAAYLTSTGGSTGPAAAARSLAGSGARVIPSAQWGTGNHGPAARQQWIALIAIIGPALLYALLAIVNTMMMSTGDRLRDFATLRLTGGRKRQVLGMVALEGVLVIATAGALALLVTATTQEAMVTLLNRLILHRQQTSVHWSLPWIPLAASIALCLALSLVASLVPARLALRGRPLDLAAQRQ